MEFLAVAKSGVRVYSFQPGQEPVEAHGFPAVRTAEGASWSADGALLGLETTAGGVAVYSAAAEYERLCEVPPLVGGPVRNFYFSPLGNHLVTHERYVKDGGNNVGVWDTRSGKLESSFVLKKFTEMAWPALKWTSLETHCCRMVQDGVLITAGQHADPLGKIEAPGIMAFEVAPRGAGTGPPHVALCVAESKGAPARCQVFRLDEPSRPQAARNFFKAQTVQMQWNGAGTALLVRTSQEVDDTGKSYYGGSHLYFIRADGEESSIVASPDDGPIHDVQWSPTQDEFCLLHGTLPCAMTLHEGRRGQKRMDLGSGHRNTIRWSGFGRFLVLAGHGQLIGDTDFWDRPGKRLLGSIRMECCVVCGWAPDGRHFLGATTSPRMRVDNKLQLFDYCGRQFLSLPFEELLAACWRPRPRGAFQDRPPSPDRASAPAPAPKREAYRPPGARAGGLAEVLRKELGSTAGGAATTATKIGRPQVAQRLPPGAAPDQAAAPASASASASAGRNARKKRAKDRAEEKGQEEEPEARAPGARGEARAPDPGPERQREPREGPGPAENPEVEKKVRALRKKLRDIEKLKEKPDKELDPLQREKIAGEAGLVQQIRELGAEP